MDVSRPMRTCEIGIRGIVGRRAWNSFPSALDHFDEIDADAKKPRQNFTQCKRFYNSNPE
jgi:hypothetical protein